MRFLRSLIFAIVIASAFFTFHHLRHGGLQPTNWMSRPQHVEITEAAGGASLDGEETEQHQRLPQEHRCRRHIYLARDDFRTFFYGLVPQEGQGSGFVIDKEGHILTNFTYRGGPNRRGHASQPQEI